VAQEHNAGHEDFARQVEIAGSSDRSFGLVMAAFFALLALVRLLRGGGLRKWALLAAAILLLIALVRPGLLHLLNQAWGRIGLFLSRVFNPVFISLIFFVVVTPLGLLFRLFGRDALRLRSAGAASYWIRRQPPGPSPESMRQQF